MILMKNMYGYTREQPVPVVIFLIKQENKTMAAKEFTQIYPKPGWVEHDPMEIWSSQISLQQRLWQNQLMPVKLHQ